MSGRPAYIVDLFATSGRRSKVTSRVEADDSAEAVLIAKSAIPGYAGAVAFFAFWGETQIAFVATLETVGDLPEFYLESLIGPLTAPS